MSLIEITYIMIASFAAGWIAARYVISQEATASLAEARANLMEMKASLDAHNATLKEARRMQAELERQMTALKAAKA